VPSAILDLTKVDFHNSSASGHQ